MKTAMPLVPRMSEKAYAESLNNNTYVFVVPMNANEHTVASAVTAQFAVGVEDVRTVIVKGKVKKSYRKGARPVTGKRADFKKAYVRVKAGDSINIFGEEDAKKAKKSEEKQPIDTKSAKSAATDGKKRGIKGVLGRAPRQTQNRGGDK